MAWSARARGLVLPACLLCRTAGGVAEGPAASAALPHSLRFAVLEPAGGGEGPCCTTPFFRSMFESLREQPGFREDPADAELLFVYLDTLRMCEWPALRMRPGDKPGCVEFEGGASDDERCGWCCPRGIDVWEDTVRQAADRYGPQKVFVHFKNAQDTKFECHEFGPAKLRAGRLPAQVVHVGFQLQRSELGSPGSPRDDPARYPLLGVNMLVPLLPQHKDLPVDDEERLSCRGRELLASFSGQRSTPVRDKVFDLEGAHPRFHVYRSRWFGDADPAGYEDLLRRSEFGFVPRGDEHYTFRLTEVVAAGAVPVMIDDDFVPPFGWEDVNDWAVVLGEDDVASAPWLLNATIHEDICRLRRGGLRPWRRTSSLGAMVGGLLEGLRGAVAAARRRHTALPTPAPTLAPTPAPTPAPAPAPTPAPPTLAPPTPAPTAAPTEAPTTAPAGEAPARASTRASAAHHLAAFTTAPPTPVPTAAPQASQASGGDAGEDEDLLRAMAASRAVEQVPWGRAWAGPAGAAEALPPLAAALAALAAANALCCAVAAVSYWRPLPAGPPAPAAPCPEPHGAPLLPGGRGAAPGVAAADDAADAAEADAGWLEQLRRPPGGGAGSARRWLEQPEDPQPAEAVPPSARRRPAGQLCLKRALVSRAPRAPDGCALAARRALQDGPAPCGAGV